MDTPPAFDDHVLAAFDESDIVALLATLDIPALKNLKLTLETLDLLNYPRDRGGSCSTAPTPRSAWRSARSRRPCRRRSRAQIPSVA